MSLCFLRVLLCACVVGVFFAASTCAAPLPSIVERDAAPAADLTSFFTEGAPYWQERYRYENAERAGFATDANAQTLRTVLGYKTGIYKDVQVDLGLQNIAQFFGHDYNDGSDGRTQFPTAGDAATTQLYHAYISFTGLPETKIIAGRQDIALDNQRWVGAPDWRIAQTFDGVTVDNKSLTDFDLFYGHLFHINRSPGDNVTNGTYDMDTDLFHGAYTGIKDVRLVGYSYLANIANTTATPGSVHGLSTMTNGFRVEVKVPLDDDWQVIGNGDYARQNDYGNNEHRYGLNYYLLEPGLVYDQFTAKFGYEVLGSNGIEAVQAPMMAAHPINGWADQFTIIPVNGLVDRYVHAIYRFQWPHSPWLNETKLVGQFHSFRADYVDQHYGDEYDLNFSQKFLDHYTVATQVADYVSDHVGDGIRKITFSLQYDY